MAISLVSALTNADSLASERLLQNLKDYTAVSFALLWQRQAIFFGATLLTAFYFDPINALIFYCVILFGEIQDINIARRVARLEPSQRDEIIKSLIWVLQNTLLTSGAICVYAVSVALKQETGGHFTPLFFLFAAALFAAMNNHQLLMALVVRLAMYGLSFLVIVFADILIERPPLSSDIWLQFFTTIFVMYFLIDCSIVFLKLYRRNLDQLEALKEEHKHTKAAYIAKSQFVSTVSHELRTPLTSIKGSLDLLNSGALGEVPENMAGLIDMASRNSLRLSRLIDDLLDLQKIEAGELKYRIGTLDVAELVRDAVRSNAGYANLNKVEIVLDCEDSQPLLIRADEARMMQVMANMISNAVKFSDEGGVVRVGCRRLGQTVRIFVDDNGPGIPDGMKEKVFDRFSQLDSSDQRRAMGSGLGMNISKEIVEHMGGTIDYVSRVGTGTTFFTDFEVWDGSEDVEPAADAAAISG
ncbi:HAMP domain-containing histidine kinase [Ponticoccus sp. SC2-23]|uniref:sensor histidine kinase n=1 Tax=Alexandriicola marinus TaxID=2081710 RepID=UPI000FDBB5BE|nr:HAMP domain-containing sensor histidine kinase [Alexandriicola marinus]MBM1218977.1 HAMP domain-containing histidine kinase [Ponticoccus sp. SC6-9]MBM1223951.1 HAMP domain-containing histidine kinase [Ponticoccus sp. SC6-15]MBM1230270.1 HAMP domain-containing histidine kinase [Ponticoccus sp. SC6-38]MBM1232917.1 HAMP domain-containing histidine kinase [Ponticoccus sp. SC6-45]MBM1237133.1 HAMP domain-containing histidine kinase [Ponticoccus sp. SC6-49]MBM1241928.1 HAMP domain-containing his